MAFAGSPSDFGKFIAAETENGQVIRAANIKALGQAVGLARG